MRFRASPNLEDRARLTQINELTQHSRSHQNQSSHTGQHTQSTSKVVIHQASHSTTQMWFSRTRSTQCTRSRSRNDLWELRNETASSSKMCRTTKLKWASSTINLMDFRSVLVIVGHLRPQRKMRQHQVLYMIHSTSILALRKYKRRLSSKTEVSVPTVTNNAQFQTKVLKKPTSELIHRVLRLMATWKWQKLNLIYQ